MPAENDAIPTGTPTTEPARYDILGIGNAIVDVLAPASHAFVEQEGLAPGSMTLIDAGRAAALYGTLQQLAAAPGARHALQETGGGSVANSCVAAAMLGARVAYLGKVADDALGRAFGADLARAGLAFPSTPLPQAAGRGTARCMILVAPDGQRTMSTYLGACTVFGEEDVDAATVRESAITYLEGYLFDEPAAQAAFRKAASLAHAAGRKVALSLSDSFCVERHRAAFLDLLRHIDILFANEQEIAALFETGFDAAAAHAAEAVPLAVLTRGAAGSVALRAATSERVEIAAAPAEVMDSTGAGDAYAAGFLFGLTRDLPLAECGRIASIAAAEVISHYGARPEGDIKALAGL